MAAFTQIGGVFQGAFDMPPPPSGLIVPRSIFSGRIATCTLLPSTSAGSASATLSIPSPWAVTSATLPLRLVTRPSKKFIVPMNDATSRELGRSYSPVGLSSCSTRPPDITAIRSESVSASSWSWVTKTKVMPTWRCSARNSSCICSRNCLSSAPSGSSSNSTLGCRISARASAIRCRCPPDSSLALRSP